MIVAVIGSREFNDYEIVKETLFQYSITLLVSGGARGADSLAQRYADEFKIPTQIFYPEWDKFGKSAGMIRNTLIIDAAEMVIAFWDGKSKGTQDSIGKTRKSGKKLIIVDTNSLVSFF